MLAGAMKPAGNPYGAPQQGQGGYGAPPPQQNYGQSYGAPPPSLQPGQHAGAPPYMQGGQQGQQQPGQYGGELSLLFPELDDELMSPYFRQLLLSKASNNRAVNMDNRVVSKVNRVVNTDKVFHPWISQTTNRD